MTWTSSSLRTRPLSFRARLALSAGGLALITLLGVGAVASRDAMTMRRTFAQQQLVSSARNIAGLLSISLSERAKEVAILGGSPGLTERPFDDPAVTRGLELRRQASPEYAWLGVAGLDGKVVSATGGLLVGVDVGARPWFKAGLEGAYNGDVHEAVLLAKLLPAVGSNEPVRFIDIAVPVFSPSGELRGVLGTHVRSSWIGTLLSEAVAGDPAARNVRAFVIARDGTVLHPAAEQGRKLPLLPSLGAVEIESEGVLQYHLVSREPVRIARGPDLGWSVVLAQSVDVALAPAIDSRSRLLALGVVASVLISGIAYALAARISRPLERLAGTAKRVGDGQVHPEDLATDWGSLELSGLSRSMRRMRQDLVERDARLEHLNAHLEETVADRTQQLSRANRELSRLAEEDALTGVANRRALDERLGQQELESQRTGAPFGLLLIDVDRFKTVNDTFGHPAGDAVLKTLARILVSSTRQTDLVARFGGEEFAVLIPDLPDAGTIRVVSEKIRSAVERHDFGAIGRITVSIGCATGAGTQRSALLMVAMADEALYRAKHAGRNCCVEAESLVSCG